MAKDHEQALTAEALEFVKEHGEELALVLVDTSGRAVKRDLDQLLMAINLAELVS